MGSGRRPRTIRAHRWPTRGLTESGWVVRIPRGVAGYWRSGNLETWRPARRGSRICSVSGSLRAPWLHPTLRACGASRGTRTSIDCGHWHITEFGQKRPYTDSVRRLDGGHSRPTEIEQTAVVLPTSTISIADAAADAGHTIRPGPTGCRSLPVGPDRTVEGSPCGCSSFAWSLSDWSRSR